MPTRLYIPSTGTPPVSPTDDPGWDSVSGEFARRTAVTTRISSAASTIDEVADAGALYEDFIGIQLIYGPLATQTIAAQTVKLQMRASETAVENNLFLSWSVRVVDAALSTFQTLVALRLDATELATTLTNRGDSATSTSVDVTGGSWLLVEIGASGDPDFGFNHRHTLSVGDNSGTDLPEDDTETTGFNPWVEFANTVLLEQLLDKWSPTFPAVMRRVRRTLFPPLVSTTIVIADPSEVTSMDKWYHQRPEYINRAKRAQWTYPFTGTWTTEGLPNPRSGRVSATGASKAPSRPYAPSARPPAPLLTGQALTDEPDHLGAADSRRRYD